MRGGESSPNRSSAENWATLTRAEAAPEQYRAQKCERACRWLDKIGFTARLADTKHFFGKDGDGSHSWFVDKNFSNAGNKTGNNNFQKIDALNVADFETASKYARNQTSTKEYIAKNLRDAGYKTGVMNGRSYELRDVEVARDEVYQITADNPNARFIDGDFKGSLLRFSPKERQEIGEAIRGSLPSVLEACPLEFEDRDKFKVDCLGSDIFKKLYSTEDASKNTAITGLSEEQTDRICRAANTRMILERTPVVGMRELLREFLQNKSRVIINGRRIPISQEYFANYMRELGIIGVKRDLNSGRNVDVSDSSKGRIGSFSPIFLFDLSDVDTKERNEARQETRFRIFGNIALRMNGLLHDKESPQKDGVIDTLERNLYVSPHEIVESAKKSVPWARYTFEKDAGNWEHYSLQEHTETTLRIFEDNFADKLPAGLLPAARLALLVHDLGKPASAEVHGDTKQQAEYNAFYAARFLKDSGVNAQSSKLVMDLIGRGMHAAGGYAKDQDKPSLKDLRAMSKEIARDNFGEAKLSQNADGVFDLLMSLQTCDSGAYSRMARTRRTTENGQTITFRNHGTFDKSFEGTDMSRRRVSLKRKLEQRLNPIR